MDFPVQSRNQPGPNFPTCLGCQPPMANGKIRTIQPMQKHHIQQLDRVLSLKVGSDAIYHTRAPWLSEEYIQARVRDTIWYSDQKVQLGGPPSKSGEYSITVQLSQHMQPGLARKYLAGARHTQLHKSWSSQVLRSNGLLALSKLSMAPFTVPWIQKLSGSLTSGPKKIQVF